MIKNVFTPRLFFLPLTLTIFLTSASFVAAADELQPSSSKSLVLIDPGHGGEDFGGVVAGLSEEFVVYDISLKLQQELKTLNIASEITREKSQTIPLSERVQNAIKRNPDVFISIHANINSNTNIRGAEFYIEPSNALLGHTDFLTFLSADSDLKKLSAEEHPRFYYPNVKKLGLRSPSNIIVLDMLRMKTRRQSLSLAEGLKSHWHGKAEIREGHFHLIRQLPIPSALIEVGYLSHPGDFKILNSNQKRQELAKNLALGLKQYFENKNLELNL